MYLKLLLLALYFIQFDLSASTLSLENIDTQSDDMTMWVALFGLGLISFFTLFLSSEKIKLFKKKQAEKEKTLNKMHESQDAIISKMGENIYDIAKENIDSSNEAKSENQLLAITTNLIDFLRIKSNKVLIKNQKLKLSNLLNDISGTLKVNTKGKEFELIYNIDTQITKELTSDTLNLSKILVNILLYSVENSAKEICLNILRSSLDARDDQLSFIIQSHIKIDTQEEDFFRSNYNENTEEYDSLGLFISKELSKLMKGDLIARNDSNGYLEFVLTLPYIQELPEPLQDKYALSKKVKQKNILLIDSSANSAKNIEKILLHLGHQVKIVPKEEYISYIPYFDIYDLIFLDEKLFTHKVVSKLENANLKIVSTSNLFETQEEFLNASIADTKISKPLTIWQITNVLQHLFLEQHNTSNITHNGVVNAGSMLVHRNCFQNTHDVSLVHFSKFKEKKILLVEDNNINQKVFLGILGKSGMTIDIANHGKEALKILDQAHDYDIIFMDINMPVMDGYTASIRIRENSDYNDIPIIALSALTSSDEIAKMFSSGMNGYMSKPLQKEKLYTVFSLYLDKIEAAKRDNHQVDTEKPIKIDGLNISLGISKSGSSEIFYKEILAEFKDAYGESDLQLQKYLKDYRYEQLRILCVDVKGLTGSIGAGKLYSIVSEILKKISLKQNEYIPELVQQYTLELQIINGSIEKYLN